MSLYWKALGGLTWASSKVGTPIVKGAKWIGKKTPKKVKKYVGKEYKEMKYFAKLNPELFAGSVAVGGASGLAAGYGLKKGYQAITNGKKKKNRFGKLSKSDPNYKALKRAGYIV